MQRHSAACWQQYKYTLPSTQTIDDCSPFPSLEWFKISVPFNSATVLVVSCLGRQSYGVVVPFSTPSTGELGPVGFLGDFNVKGKG